MIGNSVVNKNTLLHKSLFYRSTISMNSNVAEPDCGRAIGVDGSPRIIDSIKSDKTLLRIRRLGKP